MRTGGYTVEIHAENLLHASLERYHSTTCLVPCHRLEISRSDKHNHIADAELVIKPVDVVSRNGLRRSGSAGPVRKPAEHCAPRTDGTPDASSAVAQPGQQRNESRPVSDCCQGGAGRRGLRELDVGQRESHEGARGVGSWRLLR